MKTILSTVAVAALLSAAQPANAFVSIDLARHTFGVVKEQITNWVNRPARSPEAQVDRYRTVEGKLNEDGLTDKQAAHIHDELVKADANLLEAKANKKKGLVADWELRQAIEYHEWKTGEIGKLFKAYRTQNRIDGGSSTGINGEYSDPHKEGGSQHFQTRGN